MTGEAARTGPVTSAATALTFLTRLPVARWSGSSPAELAGSTPWFPVVGALVGGLVALSVVVVDTVAPVWLAAVVGIVVGLGVTGALHEDGLADVADSAGAFTVARKLAVMRDSRVGTYGVLALLIVLMVRFASLSSIAALDAAAFAAIVITAHVAARWSSVALMAWLPYARPSSPNGLVAAGVGRRQASLATGVVLVCLVLATVVIGPWALLGVPAVLAVVLLCGWWFRRSLGGITGDCLGATNIAVELAVLLCGALLAG